MQQHNKIVGLFLVVTLSAAANAGHDQINGELLEPYEMTWSQCRKQEGEWIPMGDMTEELVRIGPAMLRHRQTSQQPDGVQIQATTFVRRQSFAPLRMEMHASKDGTILMQSFQDLSESGYQGQAKNQQQQTKQLSGALTTKMLHGGALGLPLVTLAKDQPKLKLKAAMMQFDASYDIEVIWQGSETLQHQGQDIKAYLADIRWHHLESGDVYPPGPDQSGGRFWLVPNPPDGFPYVPKYQTDSYAVEFVPDTCAQ